MLHDIFTYLPMFVTMFWALVLFLDHQNLAKTFLGIFMVVAFGLYLSHAVFFHHLFRIYPCFDVLYAFSSLAVYPLYYWYIRLLTVDTRLKMSHLKWLLPAVLFSSLTAVIYLFMSPEERMCYIHRNLLNEEVFCPETSLIRAQKVIFVLSRVVFAVEVLLTAYFGSKLVMHYNRRVANFYSELSDKTIVWVRLLLISFVGTSLMSILFNLIGKAVFAQEVWLLFIPSLIFSVLLFWIGYQGYLQTYTVSDLEKEESQIQAEDFKKFSTEILKEKLLQLFEQDKIYRRPDLKITHLSQALQSNRTYVSHLINSEFSCTFNDFVNAYRIRDAREMLTGNASRKYSLDRVAEEVGFGSLSSFIRVFSKVEGLTPGRYRDKMEIAKQSVVKKQ